MKSLNERRDELACNEHIYEPKWGGKDHSGYDTMMKYEINYEREEAFSNGFDAAVNELLPQIEKLVEALEMGAFHHAACDANWYADGTQKENWDGIGDPRKAKPCTCARKKIDEALASFQKARDAQKAEGEK